MTAEERQDLEGLINKGKAAARTITRARVLLEADASEVGPAWTDERIKEALDVGLVTVYRIRQSFVEDGLQATLRPRKTSREYDRKLDGEQEAHLIALACGEPPPGRARWSLRLLAERFVDLGHVDEVCPETVRQIKSQLKPHLVKMWCIPPKGNAEFVWRMEEILSVYELPYDPERPMVCMDESGKRLVAEVRTPRGLAPGKTDQVDYEYERRGTCNLFMFLEPLRGWRRVWVTARRRKVEWAYCVKALLEENYPRAKKVLLVSDDLNTHTGGASYEAFPAKEAKASCERLEFHDTPKHGSWLNMAETELSVLGGQCLDRRMDSAEFVTREVAAWEADRNRREAKVRWQFTTEDARIKLEKLYPVFEWPDDDPDR